MMVKIIMPKITKLLKDKGLDKDGDVQRMLTHIICSRMTRYMPASSGTRVLAAKKKMVRSPTEIYVAGPYAHYQHEGVVWGPNFPRKEGGIIIGWWSPPVKYPTDRKLQHSTAINPDAGPLWGERLMAAEEDEIKADIAVYIARRDGK